MENDEEMLRIMEPLLGGFLKYVGVKTTTPDVFVPLGHQTKEFFQNILSVLNEKKSLILKRWQKFFENSCLNALSTHEMYLRYVMFACETQARLSDNIFDKILNVFALVVNFNIETLLNSWINFCELSVDIFMEFYKSTLKDDFYKQGGFEEFAEYLRICHDYLARENSNSNNLEVSTVNATKRNSITENLLDKTEKEIETLTYDSNSITHYDVIDNTECELLAKSVLSTTKIKLPNLPDSNDLKVRVQAALQQKALILATSSKRETSDTVSKDKTTDAATTRKASDTVSKDKTIDAATTRETSDTVSEDETTDTAMTCETSDTVSGGTGTSPETSGTVSGDKTTGTATTRETPATSSKRKKAESVSSDEKPERDWKRNAVDSDSEWETAKALAILDITASEQQAKLVKQQTHVDWLDNISDTYRKHIDSKCSDPAHANSRFHKEADKFLEQLGGMIMSLINSLEDSDED